MPMAETKVRWDLTTGFENLTAEQEDEEKASAHWEPTADMNPTQTRSHGARPIAST